MTHGETTRMNSHNAFQELEHKIRKQIKNYVEHNVDVWRVERLTNAIVGIFMDNISEINKAMSGKLSKHELEKYDCQPTLPKQHHDPEQLELPLYKTHEEEPIFKNENDW